MESTGTTSQQAGTSAPIVKSESVKEFDAIYSMSAMSVTDKVDSTTNSDTGRRVAGSTFPRAVVMDDGKTLPSHSFSDCDPSSFSLRVGPNYAKNGNKAPAGPSLYEVIGSE